MDRELATDEPARILADEEISHRSRAPGGAFSIRPHDGDRDVPDPISRALTDLNFP